LRAGQTKRSVQAKEKPRATSSWSHRAKDKFE
jgi:hypothetical protein